MGCNPHIPRSIIWYLFYIRKKGGTKKKSAHNSRLFASRPVFQCGRLQNPSLYFERSACIDMHAKLADILGLSICQNLSQLITTSGSQSLKLTASPFLILSRRSRGRLVAKSRTSLVFSGGICLRMIWPGGTVQSSRGMRAPEPT